MSKIDFTGQKIGRLSVIKGTTLPKYKSCKYAYLEYECVCECNPNQPFPVAVYQLAKPNGPKSCGCLKILLNLTDQIKPGDKFNRLTVIGFDFEKKLWEYRCDCGETLFTDGKRVRSGNTKSCGCLNTETSRAKAIKFINDKSDPEPKKVLAAKIHRDRYSDSHLTFEDFFTLSQEPCAYCSAMQTCSMTKTPSKHSYLSHLSDEELTFRYNGLDRVDSNLGHSLANCITACTLCNRGKREYTLAEFVAYLQRLVQRKLLNHISLEEYRAQHKNIDIEFFNDTKTHYSKIASIKYRQNSTYKDIDFDIPIFYQLTQLSCYYCGCEPQNRANKAKGRKNADRAATDYAISTGDFYYNGLDCIDPSLPHHYSNIIPCCGQCNFAKGKLTFAQFNEWIDRVANYLFPELINDKPQTSPPPSL